jgi:hypothetical protein
MNLYNNNLIVFCQAPADVQYVLDIYIERNTKDRIQIYVINVYGVYQFLKSLNLNIDKLEYIPYKLLNIKKIWMIPIEKKRIRDIFNHHFKHTVTGEVVFFSRFEDWLTAAFLTFFLRKKNVIINYVNHYDSIEGFTSTRLSFRLYVYKLLLKWLTGIWFDLFIRDKLPEFPYYKYRITEQKNKTTSQSIQLFSYQIPKQQGKFNVLLFLAKSERAMFDPLEHDRTLIEVIKVLKSYGFNIIIKGHPRVGLPPGVEIYADIIIPEYVPGEFISIDKIALCIGVDTNTLCHFAKNTDVHTWSIIKLILPADISLVESIEHFLRVQSDNKIDFIKSKNTLKEKLEMLINPI